MKQYSQYETDWGFGVSKTYQREFQKKKYGYGGAYRFYCMGSHKSTTPLSIAMVRQHYLEVVVLLNVVFTSGHLCEHDGRSLPQRALHTLPPHRGTGKGTHQEVQDIGKAAFFCNKCSGSTHTTTRQLFRIPPHGRPKTWRRSSPVTWPSARGPTRRSGWPSRPRSREPSSSAGTTTRTTPRRRARSGPSSRS